MLTARQHNLLMFIDRTIKERGVAPSLGEMASEMGYVSRSSVFKLIEGLIDRGFLARLGSKARALEVCRLPGDAPANVNLALYGAVSQVLGQHLNAEDIDGLVGAIRARGFDVVERAA